MEEQSKNKEEIKWDKLKISLFVIFCFILFFFGYEIKSLTLNKNSQNPSVVSNPKNSSTIIESKPSIKDAISQNIEELKKEATSIDIAELATSSPQVQKVINDLKSLQSLPQSRLRDACIRICNGL
jgi:hypothetical protein